MKSLFARGISRVARFVAAPIVRRRAERRRRVHEMYRVARAIQEVNAYANNRRLYIQNHYDGNAEVLNGAIMKLVPIVADSTLLVEAIEDGMAEAEADEHRQGITLHPPDEHHAPVIERPSQSVEDVIDMQARYAIKEWDGGI